MESFRARRWRASQLLALAGEAGSGKSLTQNLLTEIFGGRSTKPYQFMKGDTAFNSQIFAGEHLMLEDESERIDIRSRRHFAAMMKTLLASRDQSHHAKHREALILRPVWRGRGNMLPRSPMRFITSVHVRVIKTGSLALR